MLLGDLLILKITKWVKLQGNAAVSAEIEQFITGLKPQLLN
jgi:hypothetical protein